VVAHVYKLAAGPGDDAFETVCIAGPFDGLDTARAALASRGWVEYEPMYWVHPERQRGPSVELVELGDLPRA
jgi:hypothetical protein